MGKFVCHGATTREDITSIYSLKALCAFFVVIIHSAMWGQAKLFYLLQIAVPCFFAVSGYFLFADDVSKECAKAWKWGKKTLLLFAFFCVAYALFHYFMYGKTFSERDLYLCLGTGAVPSVHLWYLNSMWQALVLFVLLRRSHCWHPIAVVLMLLGGSIFSVWSISHCLPHSPWWRFAGPLWALPLMGGGYFARKYNLQRFRTIVFVIPLAVALPVASFYPPYSQGYCPMFVTRCCYLVSAVSVLALCVKYSHCSIPIAAWIGKYHSANIYYFHVMVKGILLYLSTEYVGVDIERFSPPLTFAVTLLLSVMIGGIASGGRKIFLKQR